MFFVMPRTATIFFSFSVQNCSSLVTPLTLSKTSIENYLTFEISRQVVLLFQSYDQFKPLFRRKTTSGIQCIPNYNLVGIRIFFYRFSSKKK